MIFISCSLRDLPGHPRITIVVKCKRGKLAREDYQRGEEVQEAHTKRHSRAKGILRETQDDRRTPLT